MKTKAGESALRNAFKGRIHKERSQPFKRRHLGFLQKHQDYAVRAKHRNQKKAQMKSYERKAEFKNPDEFYNAMHNSKLMDGVFVRKRKKRNEDKIREMNTERNDDDDDEEEELSRETLLLMQTQDQKYIQLKRQAERKKIEQMQSSLHFTSLPKINSHTFFVENEDELQQFEKFDATSLLEKKKPQQQPKNFGFDVMFDIPDEEDEEGEGVSALKANTNSINHLTREILETVPLKKSRGAGAEKLMEKEYQRLAARLNREKMLSMAESKLQLQRNLQDKRPVKKVKKNGRKVHKWSEERKK